ncbi:uncharacterized protein [Elaeis guineensis]|uniref:Uncharacterized protein LOC105054087 isoform X1 n=1 Tax=Elaeis guineensis var. tenera TaxID=51953 RepID=A0A6I9RX99_ELAGV|nr:uncharacterized protein LOC105054087 isoform X1 [Elaeis guineensis]
MFSIYSSLRLSLPLGRWRSGRLRTALQPIPTIRVLPRANPSSRNEDSVPALKNPLDYDPSRELLGLDVDPQSKHANRGAPKLRSWFGPNGQYIRELPCPSCRGRGYTPCTECGIERSRSDCSQCNGKGIRTCRQCLGDCVIWEESIDERLWEKARSSSPLKVKEDDEVDKLDINVDFSRKSKRVYQSPSPEVSLKISRSLRSLNAKTGLFSKRMKIIHRDPILHAQRVASIKKAKGTAEARLQASEAMKAFFGDPENRIKRSIAMKGVKFYCRNCGEEGHRGYYCPTIRKNLGKLQFRCRLCGEKGHNRRTCGRSKVERAPKRGNQSTSRRCTLCGQNGHNRRTCPKSTETEAVFSNTQEGTQVSSTKSTYLCSFCLERGHNKRTCPRKDSI